MSMNFFTFFLVAWLPFMAILVGIIAARKQEEGGAPSVLDSIPGVQDYSNDVWKILMDAYTKMRKGRVAGFHPWISACIAEIDRGGDCPPDVAEIAIWRTIKELPKGRYNIAYLYTAIMKLKELGA